MLANKDAGGFFEALAGTGAHVFTVPFEGPAAEPAAVAPAAPDAITVAVAPSLAAGASATTTVGLGVRGGAAGRFDAALVFRASRLAGAARDSDRGGSARLAGFCAAAACVPCQSRE